MQEDHGPIELIVIEKKTTGGISLAVVVSMVVHLSLLYWFATGYRPVQQVKPAPIARYVELIRQNPQQDEKFVEAPGRAIDRTPLRAPLSDANRRAAMPSPNGDRPTLRPGDGRSTYSPPVPIGSSPEPRRQPVPAQQAQNPSPTAPQIASLSSEQVDRSLAFRVPKTNQASAAIDWRGAISDAGRAVSEKSGDGGAKVDFGNAGGGESGFTADTGPLSFETKWFNWGDYAVSMVSRIRVNWYSQMPPIIRTGLKGVVTIRFTIHRDGRISDVSVMESSGVPPYDYAARKAIEMSSPLNPLPKEFPNPTERVVAMFFYNSHPPE